MSGNHLVHGLHALKHASEEGGTKGALAGAVGTAVTVAALVPLVGLALTPLGWGVMAAAGAAAGGTGLLKKLRNL